jgi:hypothetical protein
LKEQEDLKRKQVAEKNNSIDEIDLNQINDVGALNLDIYDILNNKEEADKYLVQGFKAADAKKLLKTYSKADLNKLLTIFSGKMPSKSPWKKVSDSFINFESYINMALKNAPDDSQNNASANNSPLKALPSSPSGQGRGRGVKK